MQQQSFLKRTMDFRCSLCKKTGCLLTSKKRNQKIRRTFKIHLLSKMQHDMTWISPLPIWLVKEVISDLMSVDVVTRGTMEGCWVVDGCQHSGSSLPFAVLHSFSFCFSNFLKNQMNEFGQKYTNGLYFGKSANIYNNV